MKKSLFILTIIMAALLLSGAACEKTITLGQEGQACDAKKVCAQDLKCVANKCSSGKVSSACVNYKDCQSGLYCVKSVCSNPPSYKKYFTKISIAKMKQGLPPGPNNLPVPTTSFKTSDAIEIDLMGTTKEATGGTFYYELINSTTGETDMSSKDYKQKITTGNWGTGFGIPGDLSGDFDLNIYFNDELIYTTPVTISQ